VTSYKIPAITLLPKIRPKNEAPTYLLLSVSEDKERISIPKNIMIKKEVSTDAPHIHKFSLMGVLDTKFNTQYKIVDGKTVTKEIKVPMIPNLPRK